MKVIIDQSKCIASGHCVLAVPEVFDQREEDGIVVLLAETPPEHLVDDIRQAAALCRQPGPTTTRSCACAWSSWPAPGCARASSST